MLLLKKKALEIGNYISDDGEYYNNALITAIVWLLYVSLPFDRSDGF